MKYPKPTIILLAFASWVSALHAEFDVEVEPNDTPEQANPITLGRPIQGQISSQTDLDWFAFSASQPMTVRLDFDSPTSWTTAHYHRVECHTEDGDRILGFNAGEDKTFFLLLSEPGIYYFRVSVGPTGLDTDPYALTISGASASAEAEPNDTPETATPIHVGTPVWGQIMSDMDDDWFLFQVGDSGQANVHFNSPTNWSSVNYHAITVRNPAGSTLASFQTGKDVNFNIVLPEAGDYLIRVSRGEHGLVTDQYSIELVTAPSPPEQKAFLVTAHSAVELAWESSRERSYSIERTASLESPQWLMVAGPFPGTGQEMRYFDSTRDSSRGFYRVVEH